MNKPLTVGSLFSGIGGMDLGLERAGMRIKWQVENDSFCIKVLNKHWPKVKKHDDIKTFFPKSGQWAVDVICGGFPCQDISNAGTKKGLSGERSGLWLEMVRIIRTLRPKFVIVENVSALLNRGMGEVLRDLAESGYNAQWQVLSAYECGAEHKRDRLFIIANLVRQGLPVRSKAGKNEKNAEKKPEGIRFANLPENERIKQSSKSDICREIHGIPGRMDRIKSLGNAVVPQVAQVVGLTVVKMLSGDLWST